MSSTRGRDRTARMYPRALAEPAGAAPRGHCGGGDRTDEPGPGARGYTHGRRRGYLYKKLRIRRPREDEHGLARARGPAARRQPRRKERGDGISRPLSCLFPCLRFTRGVRATVAPGAGRRGRVSYPRFARAPAPAGAEGSKPGFGRARPSRARPQAPP